VESARQVARLQAEVKRHDVKLPDLTAKTIRDALLTLDLKGPAKRCLEIRQAVSKASTAKYLAALYRSGHDGRIRDAFVYHTASTGRWGGAGFQPQNLPRGNVGHMLTAYELLTLRSPETLRLFYTSLMDVYSSCLRTMIKAPKGKKFFGGDFNAIETRVLFWLARHGDGLAVYRSGGDLYRVMAAHIYSKKIEEVTKAERELGKRAVLGCGYGMGWKKFRETCRVQGDLIISEDLAKRAVNAYRTLHFPVPQMWKTIEKAALMAVREKRTASNPVRVHFVKWFVEGRYLYCQLPSGRRLAYVDPSIRLKSTPWDERVPVLYHYGFNSMIKKWLNEGTYGGRLVENIVQAVARDFMVHSMEQVEDAGFEIVTHTHDELLTEGDPSREEKEFEELMARKPAWGKEVPIKVEAEKGDRYYK
jgi:DNA polymerase